MALVPNAVVVLAVCVAACRTQPPPPSVQAAPPAAARAATAPATPPASAEACRACRGDWGVHGLADRESCNCRTADVGKRCRDGADCQGMCIGNNDNIEREVIETGPPARGYFVGRCSELMTVYGCNRIIERGIGAHPVPLAEPPQMICVD